MYKISKAWSAFILSMMTVLAMISVPIASIADETSPAMTTEEIQKFKVDAEAAFSVDYESGKILYNQNGDTPMGIASITKIISLYLVLEQVKNGTLTWNDSIPISDYAATLSVTPDLSNVPLHQDITYTTKDLFDASIIQSANAAIVALAEKIAGSESAFVNLMREKLETWGIKDATIVNASGLNNMYLGEQIYPGTAADAENLMSAKDVAIVAENLLKDYPEILKVTSLTTKIFGEGTYSPVEMVNWNWMLPGFINAKAGVDGLKTGTTDLAGACFVGTAAQNNQRIITVVLNTHGHDENPSVRFNETSKLMDYSFEAWQQEEALPAGAQIANQKTINVKDGKELTTPVSIKEPILLWVRKDMNLADLTTTVEFNKSVTDDQIQAPVEKGMEIATVTASLPADNLGYLNGDGLHQNQSPLIVEKAVEKANIFVIAWRGVTHFFSNLF